MEEVVKKRRAVEEQMQIVRDKTDVTEYSKLLSCGSDFFTEFEQYIFRNSDEDRNLSKLQADDILNSFENIFDFILVYNEAIKALAQALNQNFSFPQGFLSTAQSIYKKYRAKKAKKYENKFQNSGIPISGFQTGKKLPLQTKKIDFLSVIIGSFFLVVGLIIAFHLGINSSIQYLITRIIIAIGAALVLSGLCKGMIEAEIKAKFKVNRITITAFGAIVIFLLIYLINPANPPEYKTESELNQITTEK